jgi:hypothetical protein
MTCAVTDNDNLTEQAEPEVLPFAVTQTGGAGYEPADNEPPSGTQPGSMGQDYPVPHVLSASNVFEWCEEQPPDVNFAGLGEALAQTGDLFRRTEYAGGLVLASPSAYVPITVIANAATLSAVIADRLRVQVTKWGCIKGGQVPAKYLKTMLRSEVFLRRFRPVDRVEATSRYLGDFGLTQPGYNDGGRGQRVLHRGEPPWVEPEPVAIKKFLDVMAFSRNADRTNALAAALTVLLRNHWPGGKPCLVVTSTKSHGGKETVVQFAAGTTRHVSISYESTDWAMQKAFVSAVKHDPEIGLVDVENARLDRSQREIRSAYLERFLTDREPELFSPGTGDPVRRPNDIIVAITTNEGSVAEDLLNRALPIRLAPTGDVADRDCPIGNPKLEYLPANRDRIEAELRGMIERWKEQGRPLDKSVHHPFGPWASTIGGILEANGFSDFLTNYGVHKTSADPVRRGLGLIGAERPDQWLRAADWAATVRSVGLVRDVVPPNEQGSDAGHERGLGVILSAHVDETFEVETENERLRLKLLKKRSRFESGKEATIRYRFEVLERAMLPADDDEAEPYV